MCLKMVLLVALGYFAFFGFNWLMHSTSFAIAAHSSGCPVRKNGCASFKMTNKFSVNSSTSLVRSDCRMLSRISDCNCCTMSRV